MERRLPKKPPAGGCGDCAGALDDEDVDAVDALDGSLALLLPLDEARLLDDSFDMAEGAGLIGLAAKGPCATRLERRPLWKSLAGALSERLRGCVITGLKPGS